MAVMVSATPPMKPASPATCATSMGSALATVLLARRAATVERRSALREDEEREEGVRGGQTQLSCV